MASGGIHIAVISYPSMIINADDLVSLGAREDWITVTTTVVDQARAGPYNAPPQG